MEKAGEVRLWEGEEMTLDEIRCLPRSAWVREHEVLDHPKHGKGILADTVKEFRKRVDQGRFPAPFRLTKNIRSWAAGTLIDWAEANPQELRRQPSKIQSVPTTVYRHFDKDGELLYVGISMSFLHRQVAHRRVKSWFDQIATITLTHYPSRREALDAETLAIRTESPKYNRSHFSLECAQKTRLAKKIGN